MDSDIRDLHMGSLSIQKPKKHQDSLFGKIVGDDGNATYYFYNVNVIKHKRVSHHDGAYTVLYVKTPKDIVRKLVEFDDFCKDHVRMNATRWFAKSLDENVIDEYYMSSVVVSPSDGCLVKLKLRNVEELLEPMRYDVLLSIRGLRFYKQRFVAEWELCGVKRLETDFVSSYDDGDSSDDELFGDVGGNNGVVEVTAEDLQTIASDLVARVEGKMETIRHQIDPLQMELEKLNGVREQLVNPRVPKTVALLDKIAEDLE
jgi:hypothetical protein